MRLAKVIIITLFLSSISLFAQEEKDCCSEGAEKSACCSAETVKLDTAKIWNKYCPVRGEEVDPESPTVMYKGKKIGFCCPGCDKKFKADPEKYMKNLSEDGKLFIKVKAKKEKMKMKH